MTSRSGLHVGVTPWQWSATADIARQATAAEALGFDSFWLPENHFQGALSLPDPLMVLSAAAAVTSRITLATTSYLLPLRTPLAAAEQIAVLDDISQGRLLLGIGRGYDQDTLAAFGVKAGSKRALFASHLEAILELLKGEPIAGCNEERRLSPPVVQRPHPPLVVAAFGPKAIEQAGSLGLPYLASPLESLPRLEEKYAEHRAACERNGHTPPDMVPVMRTLFISDQPRLLDEARRLVRDQYRMRAGPLGEATQTPVDQLAFIGPKQVVFDQIQDSRARLGLTHLIAARIRVPGLEHAALEESMQSLAEIKKEAARACRPVGGAM